MVEVGKDTEVRLAAAVVLAACGEEPPEGAVRLAVAVLSLTEGVPPAIPGVRAAGGTELYSAAWL